MGQKVQDQIEKSIQHRSLTSFTTKQPFLHNYSTMAAQDSTAGTTPAERHAIGIAFGNSNSSIALSTVEDKVEVIANEDGGMLRQTKM